MKKLISVLLAAVLAATLCCVFASAEETNVALNKTWSGVEPHEAIPQYDNDLTDGVFDETGKFNYGDGSVSGSATPWFSFYCNGDRTNLTDRVGKVDIDLAGEGLGITKVRMQVAPMIEHAEYIKVYADGEEIGTLSCTEGATIEWLELALPKPIDADSSLWKSKSSKCSLWSPRSRSTPRASPLRAVTALRIRPPTRRALPPCPRSRRTAARLPFLPRRPLPPPPLLLRRPPRMRAWLRSWLLRLPLWQVPPSFSVRERKQRRKLTGRHSRYMDKGRVPAYGTRPFLRAYSSICLDRKSAPAASSFLSASSSGRSPLSTASRAPAMSPSETMG